MEQKGFRRKLTAILSADVAGLGTLRVFSSYSNYPQQQGVQMGDLSQVERTYSFILKCMVETGQMSFYTEIAADLGVSLNDTPGYDVA
jgi:hypothetical protein